MTKHQKSLGMFTLLIATTKSKLESKKITESEKAKLLKELSLLVKMQYDYEQSLLKKP